MNRGTFPKKCSDLKGHKITVGAIAASASGAIEHSIRDGEIQDSYCRKIAEHEARHLPKLGTARVGHKVAVGGTAESASVALDQGIGHGEIQVSSQ